VKAQKIKLIETPIKNDLNEDIFGEKL